MPSPQANNLLILADAVRRQLVPSTLEGTPTPETLDLIIRRNARRLAGALIAGDYPKLRNVLAYRDEDLLPPEEAELLPDEDHRQPHPEFGGGVCEYVAWFSDNEDSRYEAN